MLHDGMQYIYMIVIVLTAYITRAHLYYSYTIHVVLLHGISSMSVSGKEGRGGLYIDTRAH